MTRLVQVNGMPLVAVVAKDGFRREGGRGGEPPREVWLGFWRATIAGPAPATAVADTIEEACDAAAERWRAAWQSDADQWPVEEVAA